MAISSFYGLEGAKLNWQGIPIFPGAGQDFGNAFLTQHAKEHFGDLRDGLVVTLLDVWVLEPRMCQKLNIASWVPIDHEPCLPGVQRFFMESGAIPIAMSKFGVEQLKNVGLDPLYMPHGCFDYDASVSVHPGYREKLGDIVTGRTSAETVVGVDADGVLCPAQILDRHIIPLRDSHALRVTTESGRSMVITRDNEVMTRAGWKAAGALKMTDYVCTMDVEHFNAQRTVLDTRRVSSTQERLRDCPESRVAQDVSRSQSRRGETTSRQVGVAAAWWRQLRSALSATAQVVQDGIGLYRWDYRRRGAYLDHSLATDGIAVSPLYATGGPDESVRASNRVAHGAIGVDDAWSASGQKRLGLGLSSGNRRARGSRVTAPTSAVSGHQASTGRVGHTLLRNARSCSGEAVVARGTVRGGQSAHLESPPNGSYEAIVAVEPVQLDTVYDLTTSTGNFLVDGMLVHNCDTSIFKPYPKEAVRQEVGIPNDAFLIGMVAANKGRPSRKGFQQALEAFRIFHAKHSEAILYLHTVADPQIAAGEDIYTMARALGIQDHLVVAPSYRLMYDPLPADSMSQIYSSLDVLLNCSMGEGFGVPVLEAASCGVPSIVTNFSSMPQVAGKAGWHVGCRPFWTPGNSWQAVADVGEIVEALELSYSESQEDRERRSMTARNHALDYDVKKVFKRDMLPALESAWERIEERQPLEAIAA